VVEDVVGLADQFDAHVLSDFHLLGNAQVHVDGALHAEHIASHYVDPLAPVRSIDSGPIGFVGGRGCVAAGIGRGDGEARRRAGCYQ